jgi:hypothetical protein
MRWCIGALLAVCVLAARADGAIAGPRDADSATAGHAAPVAIAASRAPADPPPLHRTACLYSQDHISMLQAFGLTVGRRFACAMVFNDAAPDWAAWSDPWFTVTPIYPDIDWGQWATEPGTHRRLIITENLFPSDEDDSDWLRTGAAGGFEDHARQLAERLVRAGLGDSVIRLAHEANGTWYPDSIPDTPSGDRLWVRFWQNTVAAMRSVRGAHFLFDWCVNAGTRDIPLSSFYPGDRYVDIIGVDAYDAGVPAGPNRWSRLYGAGDGLGAVRAFAIAHHKPLSIPEWGLGPAAENAGGDDPRYVRGIAWVVAHSDVAFQSYFDAESWAVQFYHSPRSIRAYAASFGAHHVSVYQSVHAVQALAPPHAPSLRITAGPAYGSTVDSYRVTFDFVAQPGLRPLCSLDSASFTPCPTAHDDVLSGLSPGVHDWTVELVDRADRLSQTGRVFIVR